MEPMLVIALLIAFVTIAAVGICAGVLVTRHRAGASRARSTVSSSGS